MPFKTTNPKDPGSLFVGANPGQIKVGDTIMIKGDKARKVTYIMGTPEKSNVHVVCKDTGPMPISTQEIEYEVFREGQTVPHGEKQYSKEELQAMLHDLERQKAEAPAADKAAASS